MSQNVKRVFDARPEYLKAGFLDHIQSQLPNSWPFITNEMPPVDGIEVILPDFVISRKAIEQHGLAPCPICSPIKPKYVKGHLLWSTQSGALYAVGHCCGHGFFTTDSLARALTRRSNAERRRQAEQFVEANWEFPQKLIDFWLCLKPAARDLDRVLKAVRVGLQVTVCKDIHRTVRDGGYLKVQEKFEVRGSDPTAGLAAADKPFGTKPVVGAAILRGGNRGISVEASVSNVAAAMSVLEWKTENDAVRWLCEQADKDVVLLRDFMLDASENVSTALTDIQLLLSFLDDENLRLISEWSRAANGWEGSVSIRNDGGTITIKRGHRKHRSFKVPVTLTRELSAAPALVDSSFT